jgi:hypothetical protein
MTGGLEKLNTHQASDLLEVMEDRYQRGSTIISQLPVSEWYKLVGTPTVADALMDRLLHKGHRVELRSGLCLFCQMWRIIPSDCHAKLHCRWVIREFDNQLCASVFRSKRQNAALDSPSDSATSTVPVLTVTVALAVASVICTHTGPRLIVSVIRFILHH